LAGAPRSCYSGAVTRRTRAILTAALLLALAAARRSAAEAPAETRRTITVTGQSEMKGRPDRVVVSFAVETVAARAGDAAAENAKRSAAVAEAVKKLLGPNDTVATTHYAVDPRYDQPKPGEAHEPRIAGYVARNEVEVTSGRPDQVGTLIDAATTAGANRVGGLLFTLASRDDLLRRALEQAGADARAQADSLARGLGVRVKGIVSASTSTGPPVMPRRFEVAEMSAMRTPTPIEAGEATVTATVQVTFEIE
jgi:uncharacterized protein